MANFATKASPSRHPSQLVLGAVFVACLVLSLADPLYEQHPHFHVEELLGFYGWGSILAGSALVLLSIPLRWILTRREDYYD